MSRSRLYQGIPEPLGIRATLRGFTLPCPGRMVLRSCTLPERPPEVPVGLNLPGSALLRTTWGCEGGCYMQSGVSLWVSVLSGSPCLS